MRYPLFLRVGKVLITLKRKNTPEIVKGKLVESSTIPEEVQIEANVQPAKYHEVLLLPESFRTSTALRVYSASEIRTLKEGTDGHEADEFDYEGDTYKVMRVQHYQMGVLDHYKAIAVRIEKTP